MSDPEMALNNPRQAGDPREQELISSVQRGQHELFYELVRPYERRVYAAALAILRNEQDAEDAAQEAMLKAFANIRQFRAGGTIQHLADPDHGERGPDAPAKGANCGHGRHRRSPRR